MKDDEHRYHAAVGGVGSGKTTFGYNWFHERCKINKDSEHSLIVGETGKYVHLLFKGYIKFLKSIGWIEGLHFTVRRSAPLSICYYFGHTVLFWSAETEIVMISTSHDWQDEASLFDEERVWEIDQRRRCPNATLLQSLTTTSPLGMNHTYEFFGGSDMVQSGRYSSSERKLVLHSSSYDNPKLPEGYTTTLEERFGWDDLYFDNFVMGLWVNLARNAFYFSFSQDNIQPCVIDHQVPRLVWSLDKNVGKMQWVALQHIGRTFNVCKANAGTGRNIQDVCAEFKKEFPPAKYGRWEISVTGDAVLHHRSEQTYTTGYQLIEKTLKPDYPNLKIIAYRGNPMVHERSLTTNKLLSEGRLKIHPSCKRVIHSIRAVQSDGKGGVVKPSKDDVTHAMEAVDHALCKLEPVSTRDGGGGAVY